MFVGYGIIYLTFSSFFMISELIVKQEIPKKIENKSSCVEPILDSSYI